eukprot:357331-Chlamydomonas_euryale.AAC.3
MSEMPTIRLRLHTGLRSTPACGDKAGERGGKECGMREAEGAKQVAQHATCVWGGKRLNRGREGRWQHA